MLTLDEILEDRLVLDKAAELYATDPDADSRSLVLAKEQAEVWARAFAQAAAIYDPRGA